MRSIQIYDTTLRDGTQGEGVSLSLQDKLQITKRLDEMGVDYVEGGYPLSNEKDAEYFARIQQLDLQHAKVCAFGMTRRKGISAQDDPGMLALANAGSPVCTVVGKTWDFHATEVLRVTLEENLAMIADSVQFLAGMDREVIYDAEHFFDGWKGNPEYAGQTLLAAARAGARLIVLCDTNGGSMPEEVRRCMQEATAVLQETGVSLGVHCHNDCELAVANSLAAVDAGAVQVQGTMNGIGERCGNADLVSVISNLAIKKNDYEVLGGRSLEQLTELSRYVYETTNMNLRAGQPFVGQSAFAHKGGMHVHAINRATASYEHMDPQLVGNARRVLISELSGRSNIMACTRQYNVEDNRELMDKILLQVVTLENQGYQFEAAEASFDLLVRKCAGVFEPHFDRVKYHVGVTAEKDGQILTEATVKVRVAGDMRHEVSKGDGS